MMRWVLEVEYNGKPYAGWQAQPDKVTVQSTLEEAIGRVANHSIETICAGRTDKGVHAYAQVVHFDSTAHRLPSQWLAGINRYLPADIVVKWVQAAPDGFHARFSATARTYQYYIYNNQVPSALLADHMLWEPSALSVAAMQQAADILIGEHDFSAFRSSKCQAYSPVKHVYRCQVVQRSPHIIVMTISANSFLYNMVRNIMGVLLEIGRGQQDTAWMGSVLRGLNRAHAGVKVSPHGLYFMHVRYPHWVEHEQYVEKYLF